MIKISKISIIAFIAICLFSCKKENQNSYVKPFIGGWYQYGGSGFASVTMNDGNSHYIAELITHYLRKVNTLSNIVFLENGKGIIHSDSYYGYSDESYFTYSVTKDGITLIVTNLWLSPNINLSNEPLFMQYSFQESGGEQILKLIWNITEYVKIWFKDEENIQNIANAEVEFAYEKAK